MGQNGRGANVGALLRMDGYGFRANFSAAKLDGVHLRSDGKAKCAGPSADSAELPSDRTLIVDDERDFASERARLAASMERFATGGPEKCTRHPHCFFGPMTPLEWAILAYKHLDHHLRQFGA